MSVLPCPIRVRAVLATALRATAGLATAALATAGCSVQDVPTAGSTSPPPVAVSAVPEAQDPCTQVALTLLDGQMQGVPSADPATLVRANEVVAQFVARYDQVMVASGVPAARAALAPEVGAACQLPAGNPSGGATPPAAELTVSPAPTS